MILRRVASSHLPSPMARRVGPVRLRARSVVPPVPRRALVLVLLLLVVLAVIVARGQPRESAPGSPGRELVSALLAEVAVVPERPSVHGYDRDCSGASACVFGPAWSDATAASDGGNGCSTRYDVLARDIHGGSTDREQATSTADPAQGCATSSGLFADPYSGRVVDVERAGVRGIHVDHVFPLKAAWDLGAWGWSPERRAEFANDTDHNLLAVTGTVNSSKSDSTPADWMPPDSARHCFYAARYLTAAVVYDLPVTEADHNALSGAAKRCPG